MPEVHHAGRERVPHAAGKVAAKYHTVRCILVPALREELTVVGPCRPRPWLSMEAGAGRGQPIILTAQEMKRPARNAAELMTLSATLQSAGEEEVFQVRAPDLAFGRVGLERARGQHLSEVVERSLGLVTPSAEDHVIVGDPYDGDLSERVVNAQQAQVGQQGGQAAARRQW